MSNQIDVHEFISEVKSRTGGAGVRGVGKSPRLKPSTRREWQFTYDKGLYAVGQGACGRLGHQSAPSYGTPTVRVAHSTSRNRAGSHSKGSGGEVTMDEFNREPRGLGGFQG